MKLERQRISIRLTQELLDNIDEVAKHYKLTRTACIEKSLEHLVRDIQHDHYNTEFLANLYGRCTRGETVNINIRLPKQYLDYLKLNCYNITACIKAALNLYILP